MKKYIIILILAVVVIVTLLPQQSTNADSLYEFNPLFTKTLAWHDLEVRGDSFVDGTYIDGEYIHYRDPVAVWNITKPIRIVGSEVYIEVDPTWRPDWHEGRVEAETELAWERAGVKYTLNKKDIRIVVGETENEVIARDKSGDITHTYTDYSAFISGPFADHSTVMFPSDTGVLLLPGDKVYIVPDGFNRITSNKYSLAMFFRAYVFYYELN